MKYFFDVYYTDPEVSNGPLFNTTHDCPSLDAAFMYAFALASMYRRMSWRVFCKFDCRNRGSENRKYQVKLLDYTNDYI